MAGYATNFFNDGTAAMKPVTNAGHARPNIIALPSDARFQSDHCGTRQGSVSLRKRISSWARGSLLASEMFCSLKLEDARGVSFQLFSTANVGALVFACFVIAVLSIAYGA